MAKNDVERITDEKIEKGGVLVKLYFDMQHEQKDKLQPLMVDLINGHLLKENGVVYCYGSIEEPLERGGTYITSGEVTALFESFRPLIGVAFRYAPAGIEVLRPEKGVHFKINELQSMLMDISQISVEYSRFILEKVLNKEDVEKVRKQMENRVEMGKKFLDENRSEGPS